MASGVIVNMGGDKFNYLKTAKMFANVSKGAEMKAKAADVGPQKPAVSVSRQAPAPSFGDNHKAGKENIEGNESAKYEALEQKSLKGLAHGGDEKELRAGHNTRKKSMKLGGGGRFAAIKAKAAASGASNPGAVAASIGIKKYGKAKMAKMAAAGKKRAK